MSVAPVFRRAVLIVGLLNLAYFFVEFAAAWRIGSVSLFADSADFFEDAAVNFLILAAFGWAAAARARLGMALAFLMAAPALAFLVMLWSKIADPTPPAALALSAVGFGALAVNLFCAFLLARARGAGGGGALARAAFLSARNDAIANVGIIAAGLVTLASPTIWPDLVIGLFIAWLNLDAAREVWRAARAERMEAKA